MAHPACFTAGEKGAMRVRVPSRIFNTDYLERIIKMSLQAWITPAISDEYIMSKSPKGLFTQSTIRVFKGGRYSESFVINADKITPDIMPSVEFDDCPGSVLPEVQIRHVLRWWQSGTWRKRTEEPVLVPELLTNNPNFVQTIPGNRNLFPTDKLDSEELLPISIAFYRNHQFWVTIKIPEDCKSGCYHMRISLSSRDEKLAEVKWNIVVLPIELPECPLSYSVFYRSCLGTSEGTNETRQKSEDDYYKDLCNMKEHGILYPSIYEPILSDTFEKAIELRRKAGICVSPLYCTRFHAFPGDKRQVDTGITLEEKRAEFEQAILKFFKLGIKTVYAYAFDEGKGMELTSQFPVWNMAQSMGLKVQTTSNRSQDLFEVAGNRPDLVVIGGLQFNELFYPEVIKGWNEGGTPVWAYEVTIPELPAAWRSRYGLELMMNGLSGACPYAWQSHDGQSVWVDDDSPSTLRDHTFTLPGKNGPIDTRQYEGFSAAGEDVKLLRKLIELGGTVPNYPKSEKAPPYAAFKGQDLYLIRDNMIDQIMDILY